MEEEKKEFGMGKFIIPIVAVAVFTLVLFGAGYAYFAASSNVTNVTNISAQLPASTTQISTTSSECNMVVLAADMVQANNSNTNSVGNANCTLNVTLNGAEGVRCTYDVALVETSSTPYARTTNVGTTGMEYEFTGILTATSGAATFSQANNATIENTQVQMDTLVSDLSEGECKDTNSQPVVAADKTACLNAAATNVWTSIVAKGAIEIASGGADVTQVYTLEEQWYNINTLQTPHAGATYTYELKAINIVC